MLPPSGDDQAFWVVPIAARNSWQFAFDVLFSQMGWFDTFTTTFGPDHVAVEPSSAFAHRFGSAQPGT